MKKLREMLEEHKKISCLLNVYEENIGNCTKVIFSDGEEILFKKSIKSILNNIAKHYAVDLNALGKKQQELLDTTYRTPLPIHRDLLLICVKTREPRVEKDPCMSYVNLYEIQSLDKKLPIIYLKNGLKIESLESLKTLKKRYHKGETCARLQGKPYDHSPMVAEDPVTYLYPATKGDIHAISKDIEEMRELLRHILTSSKN